MSGPTSPGPGPGPGPQGPVTAPGAALVYLSVGLPTGERPARGDQWGQYSGDDPQSGRGADPPRRTPHPPGAQERQRLRARLW